MTRTVKICGTFLSHTLDLPGGLIARILPINESQCRELLKTQSLKVQGNIWFHGLDPGIVHTRVAVLVGSLSNSGSCFGGSYADAYGSWDGVVVQTAYTITAVKYDTTASTNVEEIKL